MQISDWLILLSVCLFAAFCGVFVLNAVWRRQLRMLGAQPTRTGNGNSEPPGDNVATSLSCLSDAPVAMWATGSSEDVIWGNDAFYRLNDHIEGGGNVFAAPDRLTGEDPFRAAVHHAGRPDPEWYDVSRRTHGKQTIHFAQNVSALVDVETSRRDFFQTMAATFAQLSTGLTIFDNNMRLHLFNPAFVDMSGLPASFLSKRPDIATFFDRMRDARSMPEPKDYASWRNEISELAKAASEGRYEETWSLPSGDVYQVNGQPHPGGAIAFLFQDISAEVSLARQFRSELELYQSALDSVDEAIGIFSATSLLIYSNSAYRRFWAIREETPLRGKCFSDVCADWARKTGGSLSVTEVDPLMEAHDQAIEFFLQDGVPASCRFTRLQGGDLMVRFFAMSRDQGQKSTKQFEMV